MPFKGPVHLPNAGPAFRVVDFRPWLAVMERAHRVMRVNPEQLRVKARFSCQSPSICSPCLIDAFSDAVQSIIVVPSIRHDVAVRLFMFLASVLCHA